MKEIQPKASDAGLDSFFQLVRSPIKFRFFLFTRLPASYFAGLHITDATETSCTVSVPFKWFTKNPFRSTYFACLNMAAELSTGTLCMAHIYKRKPTVSMLVTETHSIFYKKAVGKTYFTCNDGAAIREAIETAIAKGEPQTITAISVGRNKDGELIAQSTFTWSFKRKNTS